MNFQENVGKTVFEELSEDSLDLDKETNQIIT
jgi:hypothetical protein